MGGGKGSSSAPAPPNPADSYRAGFQWNTHNTNSPWGGINYSRNQDAGRDGPRYNQNINLSPDLQNILNTQNALTQGTLNQAYYRMGRLPVDPIQPPQYPQFGPLQSPQMQGLGQSYGGQGFTQQPSSKGGKGGAQQPPGPQQPGTQQPGGDPYSLLQGAGGNQPGQQIDGGGQFLPPVDTVDPGQNTPGTNMPTPSGPVSWEDFQNLDFGDVWGRIGGNYPNAGSQGFNQQLDGGGFDGMSVSDAYNQTDDGLPGLREMFNEYRLAGGVGTNNQQPPPQNPTPTNPVPPPWTFPGLPGSQQPQPGGQAPWAALSPGQQPQASPIRGPNGIVPGGQDDYRNQPSLLQRFGQNIQDPGQFGPNLDRLSGNFNTNQNINRGDFNTRGPNDTAYGVDTDTSRYADTSRLEQSIMDRHRSLLDPVFDRREDRLQDSLANLGQPVGSEVYSNRYDDEFTRPMQQAYSNAANDAIQQAEQFAQGRRAQDMQNAGLNLNRSNLGFNQQLQSGQFGNNSLLNLQGFNNNAGQQNFMNQLAGLGFNNAIGQQGFQNQLAGLGFNNQLGQQNFQNQLTGRNQLLNEYQQDLSNRMGLRGQEFNELASILGLQQTQPGLPFNNSPAQIDTFGPQQLNYQHQLTNWQNDQRQSQNFMSGLFGIGGALLGMPGVNNFLFKP